MVTGRVEPAVGGALTGLVWACGIGVRTDTAFCRLNLLAYAPACLALGATATALARYEANRRSWLRASEQ